MKFVVFTSNDCPDCPLVLELVKSFAERKRYEVEEINVDEKTEWKDFLQKTGYTILNIQDQAKYFATPQIYLITKDGEWEYLYTPIGITEGEFDDELQRRIRNVLRFKSGIYNLAIDLYESYAIVGETQIPALDTYLLDKSIIALIKYKGNVYLVDYRRLKKVVEGGYNCLCIKGQKCPCKYFLVQGNCVCGLFVKLDFVEEPDNYNMNEYEKFIYKLIVDNKYYCNVKNKKCDLKCDDCDLAKIVNSFVRDTKWKPSK